MKESIKEIFFFILIFVTFVITTHGTIIISNQLKINVLTASILSGIIQVILILALFYLLKFNNHSSVDGYKLLEISPHKLCKGGSYMNNGTSVKSNFCKKYMNSECGQKMLNKYTCPLGNMGMQRREFEYSPLSDSNYENAACKDYDCANVSPVGLF